MGKVDWDPPRVVDDAHDVGLGDPVDPDIEQRDRRGQNVRQGFSLSRQRRPGQEAACRAVTDWRSAARPSDAGLQPRESRGGGVMMALPERPDLAVTPTLTESEQRAHFQCPHERGCTSDPNRSILPMADWNTSDTGDCFSIGRSAF
jgi:hypothetical protein